MFALTIAEWVLETPYAILLAAVAIIGIAYIAVVERKRTPVGEYECSCHGYLYSNNRAGDYLHDIDHKGIG